MEVLAGAAYSSPLSEYSYLSVSSTPSNMGLPGKDGRDRDGFRGLWRKLKSPDQPDEVRHGSNHIRSCLIVFVHRAFPFTLMMLCLIHQYRHTLHRLQ